MSNTVPFEMILREVAPFRDATEDDLRTIAALGVMRTFEEGTLLFTQGEAADTLYIQVSGRTKLSQVARDGQQVILRTVRPCQLFGALGAINEGAIYPASAEALEDSQVIVIGSDPFRALLQERPHLTFGLMALMTSYIQEMQQRYREMATERVDQRIARVLLRLDAEARHQQGSRANVHLSFSRQELAEMAGTTLYTVSRTLSGWEREGLLALGRERVTLTDPVGLRAIAERADPG